MDLKSTDEIDILSDKKIIVARSGEPLQKLFNVLDKTEHERRDNSSNKCINAILTIEGPAKPIAWLIDGKIAGVMEFLLTYGSMEYGGDNLLDSLLKLI